MSNHVTKQRQSIDHFESGDVTASGSGETLLPTKGAVPEGVNVKVEYFGASDLSDGKGICSEVVLAVSQDDGATWQNLFCLAVTGNSSNIPVGRSWKSKCGH